MQHDTYAFLSSLLEHVPEHLWSHLWTLVDKRSHWHAVGQGPARMAETAASLADGSDVYVAVSVSETSQGPFRRIASETSAGIMGLWADIDIADPDVHKKWNLPPSEEAAMTLLGAVGLEPTIVVHSGHGLQAWWLFKEFWSFNSPEDRTRAADLSQAWNTTLRVRAAERNWTIDSTFDLSRVMRVPGTFNRKGLPVVQVRTIDLSDRRYASDDFEPFCVDDSHLKRLGLTPERRYMVGSLVLREDASPNLDKLEALMAAEPLFKSSWERRRRDLTDQTGSSYDMSLAALAVQAGWDDQEVANLVVASRRKHRDDVGKAMRPDYMARTIGRAHENYARDAASEQMEEVSEELKAARRTGDDEQVRETRRRALESISQQLGIEVLGVIKFKSTPPSYRLRTPTGGVDLGSSADVLSWSTMRSQIVAETDKMIPRFRTQAYDRLAQMIFEVCEEQDIGAESTETGQVNAWLMEYLMARAPVEDEENAALTEYPYVEGGAVHIFGSSFRKWLWLNRGERVSQRELGRMLRVYGCEPIKVNLAIDGTKTTRSAWRLPELPK